MLHAPRDRALVLPGHHTHGGEVGRLLARAAHPVQRGPAHVQREARDQRRVAGDVHALLAHLVHAADDHVLDLARIDLDALDQGPQRVGQEVVGPDTGQLAVLLADGGPRRPHDHCVRHGTLPDE